jgi:hypothetical protein
MNQLLFSHEIMGFDKTHGSKPSTSSQKRKVPSMHFSAMETTSGKYDMVGSVTTRPAGETHS